MINIRYACFKMYYAKYNPHKHILNYDYYTNVVSHTFDSVDMKQYYSQHYHPLFRTPFKINIIEDTRYD